MTFRISSRLTMFLRLALPIFWVTMMSLCTIAIFLLSENGVPAFSDQFRLVWVSAFLIFALLIYKTIFQLMRVEVDQDFIYISNYFKTIKLPFESIVKIDENNTGLLQVLKMNFEKTTYFGESIHFLASRKNYPEFISEFSHKLKHLV